MNPAIIIIIAFPIFFIGLWIFVTFILAKMGWSKLLPLFKHDGVQFNGDSIGTSGGRINGVNYNGVLDFQYNHHGLYIKPIKIFSAFHPPIMIPWSDIRQGQSVNLMFSKYIPIIVYRDGKKLAGFRFTEKQFSKIKTYL